MVISSISPRSSVSSTVGSPVAASFPATPTSAAEAHSSPGSPREGRMQAGSWRRSASASGRRSSPPPTIPVSSRGSPSRGAALRSPAATPKPCLSISTSAAARQTSPPGSMATSSPPAACSSGLGRCASSLDRGGSKPSPPMPADAVARKVRWHQAVGRGAVHLVR